MHHIYCPVCGTKLIDKEAGDDGFVPFCTECDQYWFDVFPCASIVLVANEFQEVALIWQSYLSTEYAGFVSGYITPGETAEETAYREVEEEIGIKLDSLEYVSTVWFGLRGVLMHAYVGHCKKADFTLSSEVDRALWVPVTEAADYVYPPRPGSAIHPALQHYLASL